MRSLIFALLVLATCSVQARPAGIAEFQKMKYGFFVHYVWGGDYGALAKDKDGQGARSLEDLAARFDVERFAADLDAWQVEYVIFTAWHANINPLFPSETMKKWGLENHYCKRDLLGDIIKACNARGIQVIFYTHPRDGHDLRGQDQVRTGWGPNNGQPDPDWPKFDFQKWNDFVNDLYGELVARYGDRLAGLYLDEGSGAGDSYRVVDYPRLRKTIKGNHPNLVMVQNYYGNLYTCDIGDKEYHHWGEFASADGSKWPAYVMPVGTCFATTWWAATPAGTKTTKFTPEDMFRYTVLQAGANGDGGGVQWATGPYIGGGWETGVDETMRQVGAYIKAVAESVKRTCPSTSWLTPAGKKIADLPWGVATKSADERFEYVHVLRQPAAGTLQLPAPADGKRFAKATLLPAGEAVALRQDAGGVTLALPEGTAWDAVDTVIKLTVAKDSPPSNVAQWKGFLASSWLDTAHHPRNLNDGSAASRWVPLRDDQQPWGQVDLGQPCRISRIEVFGDMTGKLELLVSPAADFKNGMVVAARPATRHTLTIQKATYGADACTLDVTEKVRAAGDSVLAENALAGRDPAPDIVKTLRVEYVLDGKEQTASAREGETLQFGDTGPWVVALRSPVTARFVRVGLAQAGGGISLGELKVFGQFEPK